MKKYGYKFVILTTFISRSSSDDSSGDSFDSDSGGPSSTENHNDYHSGWNGSQVESGFEDDFDRISTPSSSDPWSDSKPDPFSPQRKSVPNVPSYGNFNISNDDPKGRKPVASSLGVYKPTVIRPTIPIQTRKTASSPAKDDDLVDGSPPMPSIPPPPPPPEALEILANGPPVPVRPTKPFVSMRHCHNLSDSLLPKSPCGTFSTHMGRQTV